MFAQQLVPPLIPQEAHKAPVWDMRVGGTESPWKSTKSNPGPGTAEGPRGGRGGQSSDCQVLGRVGGMDHPSIPGNGPGRIPLPEMVKGGCSHPKPNKGDYMTPKAYRPISLLSTRGKGLERIAVEKRAAHGKEHRHQWGGRKGRSVEECVTHMVNTIDRARENQMKVTILASHIAQAFPSVPQAQLAVDLLDQGVAKRSLKKPTQSTS